MAIAGPNTPQDSEDPTTHPFEAWPDEPSADECYDCDQPLAEHPMGASAITRALRAGGILEAARRDVAQELGVTLDEVF